MTDDQDERISIIAESLHISQKEAEDHLNKYEGWRLWQGRIEQMKEKQLLQQMRKAHRRDGKTLAGGKDE